jgi:ribosome-binding factor A
LADSVRIRRVAEQIRAELSQILRDEVRDPRIRLVTITRVKLATDLGAATIFYSPLGEDPSEERVLELEEAMSAVTGFARRLLSRRMKLRHTPDLRFILDDSIAEGSQTLELIRSLDVQEAEPENSQSELSEENEEEEEKEEDGETQSEA